MAETLPDFTSLIPELPTWNDGKGITPEAWIGGAGNYELAVGYSLVFWPRFERFGRYVFRSGAFSAATVRDWEQACAGSRQRIEAVVNHLHISDLHYGMEASEAQLRYLGRTLSAIYAAKLALDFPALEFAVSFNDESGLEALDYELTFWQVGESQTD